MKTIVIIQARMGSSRLPGKVLLPLGDSCALDYVVNRCKLITGVSEVIVATSTLPSDDPIKNWCDKHRVSCFRGSEEDVLSRFYECSLLYSPDYVIRVTSDCPFVDYRLAGHIVEAMADSPADIVVLEGSLPRGLAVEMVAFTALKKIYEIGSEPRHREHVTYYAYEFSDQFTRTIVQVPQNLQHSELRITLDTEEDYALCQAVAQAFSGRKDTLSSDVVDYLLRSPEVSALNKHIEQKPVV
ncbi:cytidylyltransferase domain-containing protein [Cohnella cholangitidis]|uniref:Acylneuraminate cytidylyltransferase n=1 Tax=Cohnella cholangitidis TaxID=2598458 RepID=A0A7G5BXH8_9BACL|nr:glycosyltransferase family protein [Cohnella cholangitidis]QMV41662.1 acylneuraminate cytidylyltransferase [Cohnella cholangitidis]